MAMAYHVDEEIKVVRNGQAVEAQFPIPPGVVGHDPATSRASSTIRAGANALLDKFGYKKGADGCRTLPDGKPLVIRYASRPDSLGRQQDEMWKKSFDSIGIRMEVQKDKFAELLKLEKQCKLHDAHGVVDRRLPRRRQLHAAPLQQEHLPEQQRAARTIPEYDKLYEQIAARCRTRPSATSSTTRWRRSSRPTRRGASTSAATATCWSQPWVLGFKKHPILHAEWQYIDVAPETK